jgi:hypothetical protein
MRTGGARNRVSHFHEAGFYGSDAEFRALIVPFAEEGIAAGEIAPAYVLPSPAQSGSRPSAWSSSALPRLL